MDNVIYIPVQFEGKDAEFKAIVQRFGYTYRISVDINDMVVQFEKDEEGNYRALLTRAQLETPHKLPSKQLIQAIAHVITAMT